MEPDIADRIRRDFAPSDISEATALLEKSGQTEGRIARCIVFAAGGKLDRLRQCIRTAEFDYRDAIMAGEYDGSRQLRDLSVSFLIDAPEKFWICHVAASLYARGYVLRSLDSRQASVGPFRFTSDRAEGTAEFDGKPFPIIVEKKDRTWVLHGDPNDLELYDLNRTFGDEAAFSDAVSCFILAKQKPKVTP